MSNIQICGQYYGIRFVILTAQLRHNVWTSDRGMTFFTSPTMTSYVYLVKDFISDLNSKQFPPSALLRFGLTLAAGPVRNRRGFILGNKSTNSFTKAYLPVLKLQLAIFQMSAALIFCSQVVQVPLSAWFHSSLIIILYKKKEHKSYRKQIT